jgi:hypothetical protein
MHDVLLSYSSRDKGEATKLCGALEDQGIRCWIAPRNVPSGMEWPEAIVEAIEASRAMVLLFSASSNDSVQVRREVQQAVSQGVPIVPIRLEQVKPTKALSYYLGIMHWLDVYEGGLDASLPTVVRSVSSLLEFDRASKNAAAESGRNAAPYGTLISLIDAIAALQSLPRLPSDSDEELRLVRAKVLAALPQLNSDEKGILVRSLYSWGLITRTRPDGDPPGKLDLIGADLSNANLAGAVLPRVSLHGATLSGADLRKANLSDGVLLLAVCKETKFDGANLKGVGFSAYDIQDDKLDFALLKSLGAHGYRPD